MKEQAIKEFVFLTIVIVTFFSLIIFVLNELKPEPKDESYWHISNPQIFNE
jgi:hypothetical protein